MVDDVWLAGDGGSSCGGGGGGGIWLGGVATTRPLNTERTMRAPAERNPVALKPIPQSSCSPVAGSLSHTSMGAGAVGWYRWTKPEVDELGAVDHMNMAIDPPGGMMTAESEIVPDAPAGMTPEPTVVHDAPTGCAPTMSVNVAAFDVAIDMDAGAV